MSNHTITDEQAKVVAKSILDKMNQQGFVDNNRPASTLEGCAKKLEVIRVKGCEQIRQLLAGGWLRDSQFGFMVMPCQVRTWVAFHSRVQRMRDCLTEIINK